jgi:hypothetical protein
MINIRSGAHGLESRGGMTQLEQPPFAAKAMSAIIRVGKGRGFVIAHKRHIDIGDDHYVRSMRYVVTAAHCLPQQPAVHGEPGWGEDPIYENILAPLGCEPTVWAECVFADPVGDIAVLGQPDDQLLTDHAFAFGALLEPVMPLKIAAPGKDGWLLSLEGVWFHCAVKMVFLPSLALAGMEGKIAFGMSGSPIVSADGAAIGVVCLGTGSPNPIFPAGFYGSPQGASASRSERGRAVLGARRLRKRRPEQLNRE